MAVRHEVSTSKGLETKKLTVLKAIRWHCIECTGSVYETKNCGGEFLLVTGKPCNFYPYRQGRGRPSVKLIRKECLFCMGGSYQLVRDCLSPHCSLYPFRMGKMPDGYFSEVYLEKMSARMEELRNNRAGS